MYLAVRMIKGSRCASRGQAAEQTGDVRTVAAFINGGA